MVGSGEPEVELESDGLVLAGKPEAWAFEREAARTEHTSTKAPEWDF